jgi:glycosyltransferase involved in cell wall biosynthesis
MGKIIFSIIIPHKNIPDLLQRCLNSIPRRDDIQIIVVDDNSDADKVDFSRFPGLEDKYVEVYLTKEGRGAGYARNVGLEHATGKWLLFADADDFFTEKAFEYFFVEKDSPNEIIYFKVTSCDSDTYEPADRGDLINKWMEDYFTCKTQNTEGIRYRYLVPWGKMIKKEFIERENIKFDEVLAMNDAMFSALSAYYANNVIGISLDTVYCITFRKGSLTTVNNYYPVFLSRYLVTLRLNKFLKERKLSKWQKSTINYIIKSIRFGIEKPFYFFYLAVKNKISPFLYFANAK